MSFPAPSPAGSLNSYDWMKLGVQLLQVAAGAVAGFLTEQAPNLPLDGYLGILIGAATTLVIDALRRFARGPEVPPVNGGSF